MEKKHQQEEYVDFVVTARKYKTLLTAKYKSRPMWHKPSAGDVVSHLPGTIIKIMVEEGQAVEAGQLLIGTSRTERDGTPIYEPAAGAVFAQFDWESTQEEPLKITAKRLTGKHVSKRVISTNGQHISLPSWKPFSEETALVTTRHIRPDILGFGLPFSVEETTYSEQTEQEIPYTEEQALALAKLHSLQTLFRAYPDAAFVAQKEDVSIENDILHYRVVYTIVANICAE